MAMRRESFQAWGPAKKSLEERVFVLFKVQLKFQLQTTQGDESSFPPTSAACGLYKQLSFVIEFAKLYLPSSGKALDSKNRVLFISAPSTFLLLRVLTPSAALGKGGLHVKSK